MDTINNITAVISNCDKLLTKLTNKEKVECLIYYWKTADGANM